MNIRSILFLMAMVVFFSPAKAAPRDIWIDADPACGLGKMNDVDDCWAIIAALRSSQLNVVGLSTVFGNVSHKKAARVAKELFGAIAIHAPELRLPPIYPGSERSLHDGSAVPESVRALEIALTKRRMTILALGPLTNIALLLTQRPDLANRIEAIIAVAGQHPGQVFKVGVTPILHFHDLNVRKDPDAVEVVLGSEVPLHLIPFEAGHMAKVSRQDLKHLEDGSALDHWLSARSVGWLDFWEGTLGANAFSPFDTVAVLYLVRPDQLTCGSLPAKLIRRKGWFTVRDTLEVGPQLATTRYVTYCHQYSGNARHSIVKFLRTPDRTEEHPTQYRDR